MEKKLKLWFGSYGRKYDGNEPFFFPTEQIEIAKDLEKNFASIYEEAKVLWQLNGSGSITTYKDYSGYDDLQFPPNSWKKLVFMVWGIRNKYVDDKFPVISALLKKHPEVTSCFITKLSPHALITGHCGITNAQYRIHLGLKVPCSDVELCGMEVGSEKRPWQNGKTSVFLDAHYHHVWNKTDDERYLLIVDVCRPEFRNMRWFVCTRVIVSNLYFLIAIKFNNKYIWKLSNTSILNFAAYLLYWPVWAFVAINNKIGMLKL